jgi:hypothetical protein
MSAPDPAAVASVRARLEQVASVGARTLAAGEYVDVAGDGGFVAYATRVVDLCIRELDGELQPPPRLYDFDQDG